LQCQNDGAVAGGQEGSQSAHSNSAELPAAGIGPVAGIKGLVPVHIITEGGQINAFFDWDSRNVTLDVIPLHSIPSRLLTNVFLD
jgi:hypothetical protein